MIATPQGTAGKKDGGGGGEGENQIGMNGEWEGVEGRGVELEDEEKIGKGGKMGVRRERGGGKMGRRKGEERRLEKIRGRKGRGG